jgi:pyruvate dehydrogenase E1 component
VPSTFHALGTDGFGRSDDRKALRRFFEVDAQAIAVAALSELARSGRLDMSRATAAIREFGIEPETPDPMRR